MIKLPRNQKLTKRVKVTDKLHAKLVKKAKKSGKRINDLIEEKFR